jgi:cell division protein FtsL
MNRFPEQQQNSRVRRTRDVTALSRLTLLLFCGLVLAGGFVLAAKQHFAAVQYGYENETLRSERKKLLEDYQRLALEKEKVLSPARLEVAARELGMKPATAGQIQSLQQKAPADLQARAANASHQEDRASRR